MSDVSPLFIKWDGERATAEKYLGTEGTDWEFAVVGGPEIVVPNVDMHNELNLLVRVGDIICFGSEDAKGVYRKV